MLVFGLSSSQAIGAGLLTEVFGMGNGLRSYVNQRVVDFATAKWLLIGAIPAVTGGALLAHDIESTILKGAFGAGLIILGRFLVYYDAPEEQTPRAGEGSFLRQKNTGLGETVIETASGETFRYDTCWRPPGVVLATIGAFITGLISAGLPELTTTQLIVRCRLPPRVAVATSVFVLAIAVTAGAIVHAVTATPVWYVVAWSIPGVLIGASSAPGSASTFPAAPWSRASVPSSCSSGSWSWGGAARLALARGSRDYDPESELSHRALWASERIEDPLTFILRSPGLAVQGTEYHRSDTSWTGSAVTPPSPADLGVV